MINVEKLINANSISVKIIDVDINGLDVKNLRKKYDLTQVALANIMGVTKKTVEKWEQGANRIKGSSAVLLQLLENDESILNKICNITVKEKKHNNNFKLIDKPIVIKGEISTYNTNYPIRTGLVACKVF